MPRTTQEVQYVRPKEPSTGEVGKGDKREVFVVNPREVFRKDHRYVKAFPWMFEPVEETRDRPGVEEATAFPGEKRGSRQPGDRAA